MATPYTLDDPYWTGVYGSTYRYYANDAIQGYIRPFDQSHQCYAFISGQPPDYGGYHLGAFSTLEDAKYAVELGAQLQALAGRANVAIKVEVNLSPMGKDLTP